MNDNYCFCGNLIKKPDKTTIVVEGEKQTTTNEYVCPQCGTTITSIRSGRPNVPGWQRKIYGEPFSGHSLNAKGLCQYCGKKGLNVQKVKVIESPCGKKLATMEVYVCAACKKKYRKIIVDRENKELTEKILNSGPVTLKEHIRKETENV